MDCKSEKRINNSRGKIPFGDIKKGGDKENLRRIFFGPSLHSGSVEVVCLVAVALDICGVRVDGLDGILGDALAHERHSPSLLLRNELPNKVQEAPNDRY